MLIPFIKKNSNQIKGIELEIKKNFLLRKITVSKVNYRCVACATVGGVSMTFCTLTRAGLTIKAHAIIEIPFLTSAGGEIAFSMQALTRKAVCRVYFASLTLVCTLLTICYCRVVIITVGAIAIGRILNSVQPIFQNTNFYIYC